jgi:hypothetical protein
VERSSPPKSVFRRSLLIALYVGWKIKVVVDDGKIKAVKAHTDAANQRLLLVRKEVETLRRQVTSLKDAVRDKRRTQRGRHEHWLLTQTMAKLSSANDELQRSLT